MTDADLNPMYVTRSAKGLLELRQERYREMLKIRREHPHDLCAIAHDVAEMRRMVGETFAGAVIDYSEVEPQEDK